MYQVDMIVFFGEKKDLLNMYTETLFEALLIFRFLSTHITAIMF